MPVDAPLPPTPAPADAPQTIARQLPPTKRAIEARQGGWIDFLQGIPVLARFRKSVRVGSGTALAVIDGSDGQIGADGVNASIFFADRSAPRTAYAGWLRSGAHVFLNTSDGGNVWNIGPTTGQLTQTGWTAATFTNGWSNFGSGWATAAYKLDLPNGRVNIKGFITGGTANTAAFTLPAALTPTEFRPFAGALFNGSWATTPFFVHTNGTVTPLVAGGAGVAIGIECSYQL